MSPKKKKSKKKHSADRKKCLLETSVQIRRVTDLKSAAYRHSKTLASTSDLYSSYYVLYEFKKGFIRSLIEFYAAVKLKDNVADAKRYWLKENGRKPRENINIDLLDAAILEIFQSMPNSAIDALPRIEYLIFSFITCFHTDLKGMIGAFGSDDIIKYDIFSKEDFEGFIDICGNKTQKIPFMKCSAFWKEHNAELETYINHEREFTTDALKKIYTHLTSIRKDINKADTTRISLGTADAVIAVDCPKHHCIITLDHAFEVLCGLLQKEYCLLRETR